MKQKGFEFPVRTLSGNPTNRKEYDEGYLMVDNNHRVFHVKQTKGLPYVRETGVAPELGIEHVAITEFSNRKTLGLLTDKDNNLYVLNRDYTLHKLPIDKYDPKTNTLTIMGDIFYWTLKISDERGVTTYAVDADSYASPTACAMTTRRPLSTNGQNIFSRLNCRSHLTTTNG